MNQHIEAFLHEQHFTHEKSFRDKHFNLISSV